MAKLLGRIALRTVQAVAFYFLFVALVMEVYTSNPSVTALDRPYHIYLAGAGFGLACAVVAWLAVWTVTGILGALIGAFRPGPAPQQTQESVQ